MKVYSWRDFSMGILMLTGVVGRFAAKGAASVGIDDVFICICFAASGVRYLYTALSRTAFEAMKEKQQTYKQASQELFGKWRYLAENFGAVLIIAALLWMLFAPNSGGIALLLMLGGFLYTLVIDGIIKRHVDG